MSAARRGMVVAPQPEAVEAGAEARRAGGHAVDTAVACALVQGVVAAVHGIRIDGDRWTGGAHPGRDGMALAV